MGAGASTTTRNLLPRSNNTSQPSAPPKPPRIGKNTVTPLILSRNNAAYPDVQLKILFIGLDNAGKTCIIHRVNHQDDIASVKPTNGFSRHTITVELKRQPLSKREAREMSRQAQHSVSMQFDGGAILAINNAASALSPSMGQAIENADNGALPQTPPPLQHVPHSLLALLPHSHSQFDFPNFNRSFRHSMALPGIQGETLQIRETQRRLSDTIENSDDNLYSHRRLRPGEDEPDSDDAYSTMEQFEMFEQKLEQNRTVRLQSHEVHAVEQATQFARDYHQSRSMPTGASVSEPPPPPLPSHAEESEGGPQLNNVDLIPRHHHHHSNRNEQTNSSPNLVAEPDVNENHQSKPQSTHPNHSVSLYSRPPRTFTPLPYATQLTRRQTIEVFDVGGNERIRSIWEKYYAEVYGVVFVVDAADRSRVEEARKVLHTAFLDVRLVGKPFLLLFNKKDVVGCLRDSELVDLLQLRALAEADCLAASAAGNNYRIRIHIEGATIFPSHIRNNTRRRELLRTTVPDGLRWLAGQILHPDHFNELLAKVQHDSHVQHLHDQREQLEKLERYQRLREAKESEEDEQAHVNGNTIQHRNENSADANDEPFRPINELIHSNGSLQQRRASSTSFQAMDLQRQRRRSSQQRVVAALSAPNAVASHNNDRPPLSPTLRSPPPVVETVVEEIITETTTIPDDSHDNSLTNGGTAANTRRANGSSNGTVARNSKKQPLYRRPTTKKDIERIRSIAMQHVSDDAVIE